MTARIRMLGVGVAVPLVIGALAVVAMLLALPSLPDPVAVHWGPSGAPDRFGTPLGFVLLVPISVLAYSTFAFVVARMAGPETVNQRIILAIAPFFSTVISVIPAGGLLVQSGVTDAQESPSILPVVVVAFVAGIALSAIGWMVLPPAAPLPALELPAVPALDLPAGQRTAWFGRAEPSRTFVTAMLVVGAIVVVGGGVWSWIVAPLGIAVAYIVGTLVLAVLVAGTLSWTVRVDSRGLVVRSVLGLPRLAVPLDQVESAGSVHVNPPRDFGGWGLRWGGRGRVGVIMRSGEALEVRRTDGRALVVTVQQSDRAAALLNSLARRG